jgi:hypothetical protein
VPVKYEDTVDIDDRRKQLLFLTRRSDPLGIIWDVMHIGSTVLPRVVLSLNMLTIVLAFGASASLTRMGYWGHLSSINTAIDDITALEGMELLVTFNLYAQPHRSAHSPTAAFHPLSPPPHYCEPRLRYACALARIG